MADKNFPRKTVRKTTSGQGDKETPGSHGSYHHVMYRFMDDFFTNFDMLTLSVFEDTWKYIPSITVKNDKDRIVINAEIPGMTAREIDITLSSDALMITGGKKGAVEPVRNNLGIGPEISGYFRKVIPIPSCIDTGRIRATYRNGMLRIVMPKCPEKSSSRLRIPVKRSGRTT